VLDDPRSVALSNEPVRVDGQVVGRVTSGGYGYTVGASIAYAYLPPEHAEPATEVAVEIFGDWVGGRVALAPLYDPDGTAVRS
jgi:4-methylaminobutanoate oxidase (formaldehyde-forming)